MSGLSQQVSFLNEEIDPSRDSKFKPQKNRFLENCYSQL